MPPGDDVAEFPAATRRVATAAARVARVESVPPTATSSCWPTTSASSIRRRCSTKTSMKQSEALPLSSTASSELVSVDAVVAKYPAYVWDRGTSSVSGCFSVAPSVPYRGLESDPLMYDLDLLAACKAYFTNVGPQHKTTANQRGTIWIEMAIDFQLSTGIGLPRATDRTARSLAAPPLSIGELAMTMAALTRKIQRLFPPALSVEYDTQITALLALGLPRCAGIKEMWSFAAPLLHFTPVLDALAVAHGGEGKKSRKTHFGEFEVINKLMEDTGLGYYLSLLYSQLCISKLHRHGVSCKWPLIPQVRPSRVLSAFIEIFACVCWNTTKRLESLMRMCGVMCLGVLEPLDFCVATDASARR